VRIEVRVHTECSANHEAALSHCGVALPLPLKSTFFVSTALARCFNRSDIVLTCLITYLAIKVMYIDSGEIFSSPVIVLLS
jgi:hypothetical protein